MTTPAAARASIAATLTDELALDPALAEQAAGTITARLDTEGWHITSTTTARPVSPRARERAEAGRRRLDDLARLFRAPRRAPSRKDYRR
jgi:hypothetical protein